eukprot:CAMPEP_0114270400 /NCGR_PEP_ID=MMETSP0058-20121206/27218_1 /TAXON_ID=36894 /ORGANISM="Pyramimonas parkeae, CCMP726" /LENGTH=299 /DNA_ID=CAMNT_0001389135 /DNA_START=240 /DNA_END=1139 /DNA_ORIENTATION=+
MPPFHSRAIFVHLRTGTSSDVDVNPENLLLRITTRKGLVQVNQVDVPPNEELILTLRRERPGCYICMDGLCIQGVIRLEVSAETVKGKFVCAVLRPMRVDARSPTSRPSGEGWELNIDNRCKPTKAGTSGQPLDQLPSAELSLVGQVDGRPLCLTDCARILDLDGNADGTTGEGGRRSQVSLQPKGFRRSPSKGCSLEAITEAEKEEDRSSETSSGTAKEAPLWDPSTFDPSLFERTYQQLGGQGLEEGGQITWFNAGLRVGMGIGLGVCLGMGLGVGILTRTYQRTRSRITEVRSWIA